MAPVLLLVSAGVFSAFMYLHEKRKADSAASAPAGKAAVLYSSLTGVSVINIKDNRTLWVATSKKAVFTGDGQTARLSGVSIDIPSENAKLDASGGELNLDSNILTLDGAIKSQVKGFDLKTNSVRIVPGGTLNTGKNDPVVLEKKGIEIEGRGLDANQQKKVRLEGDVKAVFY